MRMPRHTLKLIALMAIVLVAPASAGHRIAGWKAAEKEVACPYERARLAALAAEIPVAAPAPQQAKVPVRITLIDRVPADSVLGLGRNTAFVSP
jgi:hypothetical protein